MPQDSNKHAQTAKVRLYLHFIYYHFHFIEYTFCISQLSETATSNECAEFFKKFGEVKNTKVSTKNWVKSLETFCKEKGFIKSIEEITTEAELDQQLSEYIAAMKQQNGQEYSANSV